MIVKKWKPNYATIEEAPGENMSPVVGDITMGDGDDAKQKKKKKKKSQKLSTKGIVVSRFKSIPSFG